jgi:hypothetical protein
MSLFARQRSRRTLGQSLAEFALVFPILVLMLGAIIQFGLIFWAQQTLAQVTRDTGRWAVTQQTSPCNSGGPALVIKADEIARASSLLGYEPGEWSGSGFAFDVPPEPREGVEVGWPISTDPPGGFVSTDCPPDTNQIAWYLNIRMHHEVPVFFPFIGAFIPACDGDGCSLSSSVQFRMEPAQ